MENVSVKDLVADIKANLSQGGASQKDEVAVMRAMLNDKEYVVDVYKRNGETTPYCPSADARAMIASVIASTTKISNQEAAALADKHEFKKSEAEAMVNITKEYIHTYMATGRKLPLGGRATSDVSLSPKHVEEKERSFPQKIGGEYKKGSTTIAAHDSIKVTAPCPAWLKK